MLKSYMRDWMGLDGPLNAPLLRAPHCSANKCFSEKAPNAGKCSAPPIPDIYPWTKQSIPKRLSKHAHPFKRHLKIVYRRSVSSNCNLSCWLVFSLFDKRLEISQLSNSSHIYCFLNRKGALSPCTIFSKLKRAVTRLLSELGRKWKLLASLLPPFCCFRIGSVSV